MRTYLHVCGCECVGTGLLPEPNVGYLLVSCVSLTWLVDRCRGVIRRPMTRRWRQASRTSSWTRGPPRTPSTTGASSTGRVG